MTTLTEAGYHVWVVDDKYLLISWMKMSGGARSGTAVRPPVLSTNYRPQVYDPTALGALQNGR